MEASILICDFAEAINGKLYIAGGGWSLHFGDAPVDCGLAIRLSVPWTQTNLTHTLKVSLINEDGQVVNDPDGTPVVMEGKFELGRPAGTIKGEDLVHVFAMRIQGLPLDYGMYRFSLEVDGVEISNAKFRKKQV